MEAKHTPGPWHVGGFEQSTIYDHFGQRVANSFEGVMVAQRSDTECRANARLIAQAPDMLRIMQWIIQKHDEGQLIDGGVITEARAAIAKATT